MREADEARILRGRQGAAATAAGRARANVPDAARPVIVRPMNVAGETYPTAARAVYPARLVVLEDAIEKAGGTVTLNVDDESLVYVANVGGSAIPSDSVNLLAVPVAGVLVVRYG